MRGVARPVYAGAPVGAVLGFLVVSQVLPAGRLDPPPRVRPDVVLLHGLSNKHHWSDELLGVCLQEWGSRRVFLVYTNKDQGDRSVLGERQVGDAVAVTCGLDRATAGDESIATQAGHLAEAVTRLQRERGLSPKFSIIAHSMGGLVARAFVADNPDVVTGLVTLGTPHHGSPLASDFTWMGLFMGARAAIEDLEPARCEAFNAAHPPAAAPFADGGHLSTIRGGADGKSLGALGELALGWQILKRRHGVDNDGLVPFDSAVIDGAAHLADFPHLDHLGLVQSAEVAEVAARALP